MFKLDGLIGVNAGLEVAFMIWRRSSDRSKWGLPTWYSKTPKSQSVVPEFFAPRVCNVIVDVYPKAGDAPVRAPPLHGGDAQATPATAKCGWRNATTSAKETQTAGPLPKGLRGVVLGVPYDFFVCPLHTLVFILGSQGQAGSRGGADAPKRRGDSPLL